jgi:hypothetical protein
MQHRANLAIGPFTFAVATDSAAVADDMARIYRHLVRPQRPDFVDFDIALRTRSPLRRWFKPQIDFFLNERRPFKPLPRAQGYAMLEWGMNWCVANHAHQYLIVHAGVVERNGKVIVMPAAQGAGKSTLTAALAWSGWRLFSDELALLGLRDQQVQPFPRPVNLKNESIGIIADFIDGGVFVGAIVFPRYEPGVGLRLRPLARASAFEDIIGHCFNYHLLGLEAFDTLYRVITGCNCYSLEYSDFARADRALAELVS